MDKIRQLEEKNRQLEERIRQLEHNGVRTHTSLHEDFPQEHNEVSAQLIHSSSYEDFSIDLEEQQILLASFQNGSPPKQSTSESTNQRRNLKPAFERRFPKINGWIDPLENRKQLKALGEANHKRRTSEGERPFYTEENTRNQSKISSSKCTNSGKTMSTFSKCMKDDITHSELDSFHLSTVDQRKHHEIMKEQQEIMNEIERNRILSKGTSSQCSNHNKIPSVMNELIKAQKHYGYQTYG
jgi:hypothetical protein